MRHKILIASAAIGLMMLVGGCGDGQSTGAAGTGVRTIDVVMHDNDFSLPSISVKAGEQIQFVFHNNGAVTHDAFIGDDAAQLAHEQEMRASPDASHGHETDAVTVESGQTGTLTHTFDKPSTTIIGCHISGHYALGMRIRVTVT